MSVYITLGNCAVIQNNQKAGMSNIASTQNFVFITILIYVQYKYLDQIELFKDEADINELMGFPEKFYEKHGKYSPFLVFSASFSNENFSSNVLIITI